MVELPHLPTLDEGQILKYLLTEDQPDWSSLQAHQGFNEKWVVFFLKRSRPVPRAAVEEIYYHRIFRKHYQVNLHLMRCRTAPPHVSVSLVHSLRWVDLFWSLRLPYLPGGVRQKIEAFIVEIFPRLAMGEKVSLAKQASRPLIRHLRLCKEPRVVEAVLGNYFFTFEDAVFMANFPESSAIVLDVLARNKKWLRYKEVRLALMRHENTPKAYLLPLGKTLKDHNLRELLRHPKLPLFTRRLIHRILEERFCIMTGQEPTDEAEVIADNLAPERNQRSES